MRAYPQHMALEGELAPLDRVIPPGSTVGIIGGGQLGRMLALAARRLGYRLAVLDPDPDAPAFSVAERVFVAGYYDVEAALELASESAVITCELEHVSPSVVEIVSAWRPVRPGLGAVRVTQDRIAERRWLTSVDAPVAPWRAASSEEELRSAVEAVGFPCRLKLVIGGYDGRGQLLVPTGDLLEPAIPEALDLMDRGGGQLLVERELELRAELSVVCARDIDGSTRCFPPAMNRHDRGILVESLAPAPVDEATNRRAQELASRLTAALDVVGTLAVEMFLLPDGALCVNELAPRVHNSGHYTLDACQTSQFEQHIRAICGLPLGSTDMFGHAAMRNLLGSGEERPARLLGLADALGDPLARVALYDKRRVFERRKMGHVTVVADDAEDARSRAERAVSRLRWDESRP